MARPLSDSELESRFNALLQEYSDNVPESLREDVVEKLKTIWKNPQTQTFETVLSTKFTDARARAVLFFPSEHDMDFYPRLIARPPTELAEAVPIRTIQALALDQLGSRHARHWRLARAFILAGGLAPLVGCFTAPEPWCRHHALVCFTQLTNNPSFDWFTKPTNEVDLKPFPLMAALLEVGIVDACLQNRGSPTAGVSHSALEILAFWLSWLRLHYSSAQVLRLPSAVLAALRDWSQLPAASAEERELATKVWEDFSRFPPADDAARGDEQPVEEKEGPGAAVERPGARAWGVDDARRRDDMADAERREGNEAFTQGRLGDAVAHYTAGLEAGGSKRAVLLSNRAEALLRLWERDRDRAALTRALADASAAAAADPESMKAHYRRARALNELGEHAEALRAAGAALDLDPENRAVAALVTALEDALEAEREAPTSLGGAAEAAGAEDALVQSILGRHGFSAAVAFAPPVEEEEKEEEEGAEAVKLKGPADAGSGAGKHTTEVSDGGTDPGARGVDNPDADVRFAEGGHGAPRPTRRRRTTETATEKKAKKKTKSSKSGEAVGGPAFMRSLREAVPVGPEAVLAVLRSVPPRRLKRLVGASLSEELIIAIVGALEAAGGDAALVAGVRRIERLETVLAFCDAGVQARFRAVVETR